MQKMNFKLEEDEKTIQINKVTFNVYQCSFQKVKIPFPFASLLLKEATRDSAEKLFAKTIKFTSDPKIQEHIFLLATAKGIAAAEKFIENNMKNRPSNKPKIYQAYNENFICEIKPSPKKISVATNKFAVELTTDFDVTPLNLPLNLYIPGNEPYPTKLTREEFCKLKENLMEFSKLAEKLAVLERVTSTRIAKIIKTFLKNPEKGWQEYKKAASDETTRNKREELYFKLMRDRYVPVKNGAVVLLYGAIYYVTDNGEVYRFPSWKTTERKKFLLQASNGKIELNRLDNKIPKRRLPLIAQIIGKYKPELAVVLTP